MFEATWFPALMVFTTVVFGTIAFALVWEVFRDWLRRRKTAKQLKSVLRGVPGGHAAAVDLIREDETEGLLATFFNSFPWVDEVRELMRQSRLGWSVETFGMLSVAIGLATAASVLLFVNSMVLAVLGAGFGAASPYWYASRRRNRRFMAFEEQFPEAIDLLTRAIRAGHPLSSGMRMVSEEAPQVVAEEFRQTFEEQRFGLPFNEALLGMVDRINLVDVRIFIIAVLVQREVGGNLAEILDNLAETIRGRFYIRRQLRVYTAQGRMSGWILALLPPVVGSIIFLLEPEYVALLFDNFLGLFMIGVAATLQILGVLWIRRIVNIDI